MKPQTNAKPCPWCKEVPKVVRLGKKKTQAYVQHSMSVGCPASRLVVLLKNWNKRPEDFGYLSAPRL